MSKIKPSRDSWSNPAFKRSARGLAVVGALAFLAVPLTAPAFSADAPKALSQGQGQVLRSKAFDSDVNLADLGTATTNSKDNPGPTKGSLNVDALGSIKVNAGSVKIPLISQDGGNGLLQLGDAGLLRSYSSSPDSDNSKASSGAIADDGSIAVSPGDGPEGSSASLDLIALAKQLNLAGVTDEAVDQARATFGAAASEAQQTGATHTSDYQIADGALTLHSPAVANLASQLKANITQSAGSLNDITKTGGAVDGLLATLKTALNRNLGAATVTATDASATIDGLDDVAQTVTTSLLSTPLASKDGAVKINLKTGGISVDLEKVTGGLNGREPNTSLLTSETVAKIGADITEALNGLTDQVISATQDSAKKANLTLKIGVNACVGVAPLRTCQDGAVLVKGSLAQFAGQGPTPTADVNLVVGGVDVGGLIKPVVNPLVATAVSGAVGTAVSTALNEVSTGLQPIAQETITGVAGSLVKAIEPLLEKTVNLVVNEQPTPGDLSGTSFTVRALAIQIAPTVEAKNTFAVGNAVTALAEVDLASSTVDANADADANANANADTAADANANADTAADANANADTAADANANANADTAADANANADTAADANANANADTAADANANADTAADANANANADTAADANANADTAANANANADTAANANANADTAANANANADTAANANANADTAANANANASAAAAANANANANAATAANANANSASSASDPGGLANTGAANLLPIILGGLGVILLGGAMLTFALMRNRRGQQR